MLGVCESWSDWTVKQLNKQILVVLENMSCYPVMFQFWANVKKRWPGIETSFKQLHKQILIVLENLKCHPVMFQCWAGFCNAGPALKHHWITFSCPSISDTCSLVPSLACLPLARHGLEPPAPCQWSWCVDFVPGAAYGPREQFIKPGGGGGRLVRGYNTWLNFHQLLTPPATLWGPRPYIWQKRCLFRNIT